MMYLTAHEVEESMLICPPFPMVVKLEVGFCCIKNDLGLVISD